MPGKRLIHTGGENPFKPMCGSTKKDPLITFEKWKISCHACLRMLKAARVIEHVKRADGTLSWVEVEEDGTPF